MNKMVSEKTISRFIELHAVLCLMNSLKDLHYVVEAIAPCYKCGLHESACGVCDLCTLLALNNMYNVKLEVKVE